MGCGGSRSEPYEGHWSGPEGLSPGVSTRGAGPRGPWGLCWGGDPRPARSTLSPQQSPSPQATTTARPRACILRGGEWSCLLICSLG